MTKYCCHCIVHLYNGISTHVSRPTIIAEADNERDAADIIKKDLEDKYKRRSDCSLSSLTFELITEVSHEVNR